MNRESAAPILVTAANSEAATGIRWRTLRTRAAELGVPTYSVGRKLALPAAQLLAALERAALVEPAPVPLEEQSPEAQLDALRRAAGLRLVGGSR